MNRKKRPVDPDNLLYIEVYPEDPWDWNMLFAFGKNIW